MDNTRSWQELDISCHQLNTRQLLLRVGQVSFAVLDHPKVLQLGRAENGLHDLVGREVGLALGILSIKHNTSHPHFIQEEDHLELVRVDVGVQLLVHLSPGHLCNITLKTLGDEKILPAAPSWYQ